MPVATAKKPATKTTAKKPATKKTTAKKPATITPAIDWEPQDLPSDLVAAIAVNSETQIPDRTTNATVLDYALKMVLGVWEWGRPGSKPKIINAGDRHHSADGHHTGLAIDLVRSLSEGKISALNDYRDTDDLAEAINERLGQPCPIPEKIPCLVRPGTALDALRYSYTEANLDHGASISPQAKSGKVRGIIQNKDLILDILRTRIAPNMVNPDRDLEAAMIEIADCMPSARAIAAYCSVGHPTAQRVIDYQLSINGAKYPWLSAPIVGLDGIVQKIKKTKRPAPSPSDPPATTPKTEDAPAHPKVEKAIASTTTPLPTVESVPPPKTEEKAIASTTTPATDASEKEVIRILAEQFGEAIAEAAWAAGLRPEGEIQELSDNLIIAIVDELEHALGIAGENTSDEF